MLPFILFIFIRLAKEFDLKLVYRKRFEEFFEQYKDDPEGKALLRKMQALEVSCFGLLNVALVVSHLLCQGAARVEHLMTELEAGNIGDFAALPK